MIRINFLDRVSLEYGEYRGAMNHQRSLKVLENITVLRAIHLVQNYELDV